MLLLDVLKILPETLDCYIQAPSMENPVIEKMMITELSHSKLIQLNPVNKEAFIDELKKSSASDYFHSIEIKQDGKLLFEGFDGIEFGTISNTLVLPEWFVAQYIVTQECIVATNW